ncbi:MAG: hypothetical protein J6S85_03855 [Methanobrevibacter sp.]|nr:hypothetical protein [Methanobrevibacter sp.]MBO7712677.1 hypothetical protein [Methanobrevibacter sp.]
MAFSKANLTIVKDNFGGKSKVWEYVGSDDYTASNYFDPVINDLSVGDVVVCANKTSGSETIDVGVVTSVTSHVAIGFTTGVSGS